MARGPFVRPVARHAASMGTVVARLALSRRRCCRDWLAGELNVRAMSLAYTTLLSIVPLMVFSFSILKGSARARTSRFMLLRILPADGQRRRTS